MPPDRASDSWMWGLVGVPKIEPRRADACKKECWYQDVAGFTPCYDSIDGMCILLQGKKKD